MGLLVGIQIEPKLGWIDASNVEHAAVTLHQKAFITKTCKHCISLKCGVFCHRYLKSVALKPLKQSSHSTCIQFEG